MFQLQKTQLKKNKKNGGEPTPALDARPALDAPPALNAQPALDAAPALDARPALDAPPALDAAPALDARPALDTTPAMDSPSAMDGDLQERFIFVKKKLHEKTVQQVLLKGDIRGLEETLMQERSERERVESRCRGYRRDLENKCVQIYNLKLKSKELDRKLQKQIGIYQEDKLQWANMEEYLFGLIHSLQVRLEKMDCEKKQVEATLRCHIQKEDCDLETGPREVVRYTFNRLIRCNKICLFVFILFIFFLVHKLCVYEHLDFVSLM